MKKFILPCLFGLTTFLLVGITLTGCEKSSTDWKAEMLQSALYSNYVKSGLEMNNNLAKFGMDDSKKVHECLTSTGKKYDQAWIDCLAGNEQDQRYATLFVKHMVNQKALVSKYPEIGTLPKEEQIAVMDKSITKEMLDNAVYRTTKESKL
ncbi:MAG: hypothetical protein ABIV51_12200 [Saprospiraceae bacterium]